MLRPYFKQMAVIQMFNLADFFGQLIQDIFIGMIASVTKISTERYVPLFAAYWDFVIFIFKQAPHHTLFWIES